MEDRVEELKLAQSCFTKAKNEFARVVGRSAATLISYLN